MTELFYWLDTSDWAFVIIAAVVIVAAVIALADEIGKSRRRHDWQHDDRSQRRLITEADRRKAVELANRAEQHNAHWWL